MALVSLAPIILYLIVLRTFDAFSMVRWRTMLGWTAWGMASALLMLALVRVAHASGNGWTAPWVSPCIEETFKVLPLLFFVWARRMVFSAETQLYGEAVGGGFALVENVIYLSRFPGMDVATALVRGLGTGLLHMGCTALAATLVLVSLQSVSRSLGYSVGSWGRWLRGLVSVAMVPLLLLPSIGIHTLHNMADISPMTLMVGMVVVFFLAFHLVSRMGERGVVRWLDVSMNDDISLIAALREGRLTETKAGEYLAQLRSRFDSLVFFDMCVYVHLYLELLIEAKGRVMLRDAGLEQVETPGQKADRKARLAELDVIGGRIPRMGLLLLRPLIHCADQDQWAMRKE